MTTIAHTITAPFFLLINIEMTQYCPELFKNIYIEKQNQQQVKLGYCCQSHTTEPTDQVDFLHEFLENGRAHYLRTNSLPAACKICIDLELNGADSLRTRLLKNYEYHTLQTAQLRSIHYNCDPVCNLKCIICSSQYSSSWIADDVALGKRKNIKIRPTKNNNLIWNLNLNNIQFIYFNGGEPLLTNDHVNLMQKIDANHAQRLSLCYSTNSTVFPSDKVLNLWSQFQEVKLQFSIDATHHALEYIRFPASWEEINNTVKKFQQINLANLSLCLAPNIGLHNLFYLEELLIWGMNNNLPIVAFPTGHTFALTNLPLSLKQYALDFLENIQTKYHDYTNLQTFINLIKSIDQPDLNWIRYLDKLDKIRNTDWRISLSKLYEKDKHFFDNFNL